MLFCFDSFLFRFRFHSGYLDFHKELNLTFTEFEIRGLPRDLFFVWIFRFHSSRIEGLPLIVLKSKDSRYFVVDLEHRIALETTMFRSNPLMSTLLQNNLTASPSSAKTAATTFARTQFAVGSNQDITYIIKDRKAILAFLLPKSPVIAEGFNFNDNDEFIVFSEFGYHFFPILYNGRPRFWRGEWKH